MASQQPRALYTPHKQVPASSYVFCFGVRLVSENLQNLRNLQHLQNLQNQQNQQISVVEPLQALYAL